MMKKILDKILQRAPILPTNTLIPFSTIDMLNLNYENFEIVFDVGSYHGSFTEAILNKNPSIEIHAFEPNNLAFEIIKNKFQNNNVIINNSALGDLKEERILYLNNFDETNSLLASNTIDAKLDKLTTNIKQQKVNVTTLDQYCNESGLQQIDFVKVDTQGNTYNVLLGASDLLKSKGIKYLYVETEFIQIYKDEKCFSEIELLLRNMGYQLVNFYNLNYTQDGRIAWCDCLFTIK